MLQYAVIGITIAVLTGLFIGVGCHRTKDSEKIDLKVTINYLNTWTMRDVFPESVTFAYYLTRSLRVLDQPIPAELQQRIISYLHRCQKKSGGFVYRVGVTSKPNLLSTYHALLTLSSLNALDAVDRATTIRYIRSLQKGSGGFRARADRQEADPVSTYYAVSLLLLLKSSDGLDRPKAISYLLSLRGEDGGFRFRKKGVSHPQSTHAVVQTLKQLGALNEKVRSDAVRYFKQSRYSGLGDEKRYRTQPQVRELVFVVEAIRDLNARSQIDVDRIYEFIGSLFIPENGGFGPQPGFGSSPPSTYFALASLDAIGKLRVSHATAGGIKDY